MRHDDIVNALRFLNINPSIVLLVACHDDVPMVKRDLLHMMKQPRKMIGDTLYYGEYVIRIVVVVSNGRYNEKELRDVTEDRMYYVGWNDLKDEEVLDKAGIITDNTPYRAINLWKSLGMSEEAMLRALQVDGYSSEESLSILERCGIPLSEPQYVAHYSLVVPGDKF